MAEPSRKADRPLSAPVVNGPPHPKEQLLPVDIASGLDFIAGFRGVNSRNEVRED
jgi:hypothetical protein